MIGQDQSDPPSMPGEAGQPYAVGERIGGRYLVSDRLAGGQGDVYFCLDEATDRPVALKTPGGKYAGDEDKQARLLARFRTEAATWVALGIHPHIVRCFYLDVVDDRPFLVLEWIANPARPRTSLRRWLKSEGPLDISLALQIAIDVCRGLIHAGEKMPGLVHRDLKPGNILLTQDLTAKITDFGFARSYQSGSDTDAEEDRRVEGTPAYMAPEQWRRRERDPRTDVYALGCTLYEMLAGRRVYDATSRREWRDAHCYSPAPELPPAFPPDLRKVVARCLHKEPARRPAGPAALLARLAAIYKQYVGQAPRVHPGTGELGAVDYNNRANTYALLDRHQDAMADVDEAIALDPTFTLAYINRGTLHHTLGNVDAALADFDQALVLDRRSALAHFNRGVIHHERQDYAQALTDYTRAIAFDPRMAVAYYNRGNSYRAVGEAEIAITDYSKAIYHDLKMTGAYVNRGHAFVDLGRHTQALADFDTALALDPRLATAYYDRAIVHSMLGRHEQALADFGKATELEPEWADAFFGRGSVYQALGCMDEALADYTEAVRLDPMHFDARMQMGALYADRGQWQDAARHFQAVTDLEQPGGTPASDALLPQTPEPSTPEQDTLTSMLDAFHAARTPADMREVVSRFPAMADEAFMQLLPHSVDPATSPRNGSPAGQQLPVAVRIYWLQQIVSDMLS